MIDKIRKFTSFLIALVIVSALVAFASYDYKVSNNLILMTDSSFINKNSLLLKIDTYNFEIIEVFSFFTLLEILLLFAVFKNLSNPPLKSTVLRAALVTFSLIFFFKISLLNVTFFKFGINLLLVLLLEWLTLWPLSGDIPVSSHLLDINYKDCIVLV